MTGYFLPPGRRVHLVAHVARTGAAMPTAWRRREYWRKRVDHWRKVLLTSGMRPLFVEWELARFRQAVARESRRLAAMASADAEEPQP